MLSEDNHTALGHCRSRQHLADHLHVAVWWSVNGNGIDEFTFAGFLDNDTIFDRWDIIPFAFNVTRTEYNVQPRLQ